eukprot:scaffold73310_cov31-Tisochrysis_lutea.AAC.6
MGLPNSSGVESQPGQPRCVEDPTGLISRGFKGRKNREGTTLEIRRADCAQLRFTGGIHIDTGTSRAETSHGTTPACRRYVDENDALPWRMSGNEWLGHAKRPSVD